jgi:hypothetical protein
MIKSLGTGSRKDGRIQKDYWIVIQFGEKSEAKVH